jgi:hypothetical protein
MLVSFGGYFICFIFASVFFHLRVRPSSFHFPIRPSTLSLWSFLVPRIVSSAENHTLVYRLFSH